MSYIKTQSPICQTINCPEGIDIEIIPRSVDLGGFQVGRVLPSKDKRTVGPFIFWDQAGPFIFWDQAGPGEFLRGNGLDVRPHPHICLSTMTYLFDGKLEHRDTLGSHQVIVPGDVNLMTAGQGIAHSERTPQQARLHQHHLFGIQCWLALPLDKEETNPSFSHYDKSIIPIINEGINSTLRIVAGEWRGVKSPVKTLYDALFIESKLKNGAEIVIPATKEERALHILNGEIEIDNIHYTCGRMLVLKNSSEIKITAANDAHFIILGGPALEEPRYLWWNFVASSKERIEQAKLDWKEGKFGKIPGDDQEFTPLPT